MCTRQGYGRRASCGLEAMVSILRQEFLTSAVKIRISAEILRARLLNQEGKEKKTVFACQTSHLQEQITHRSGERLQAVQAGMLLEQAVSPGGLHAARCLPSQQGCGVFFTLLNKQHVLV